MTIYDIKRLSQEKSPYFFSKDSMRFFGQTLKDFRVYKQKSGKYLIIAESGDNWQGKHITKRLFNPLTNELEHCQE